ncbi:MAG: VOC family protein [Gemmatimonadaceae bacterium]
MSRLLSFVATLAVYAAPVVHAQQEARPSLPALHHVGLNSVDPERAIAWYLRVWPTATRTTFAGEPAVRGDMLLTFHKEKGAIAGAWNDSLHRGAPQSAFWHIGAFTNSTDIAARLAAVGVPMLPLFVSPTDTEGVTRSGLAPYAGILTAAQLRTAPLAPPRDGGFSYAIAPDGVLFEFTGGPTTHDSFSHVHFFREHPLCSANWYAEHLEMELPPMRDSAGRETPRAPWLPCQVAYGEAGWPSLEHIGTIRSPSGGVRYANGSMSWYPRQCVAGRCGTDQALVRSRGQPLDHVAFEVSGLEMWYKRLEREGVKILERPHGLGAMRAFMIEDPDGLAVELVETVPVDVKR